jgi:hypothetical protein
LITISRGWPQWGHTPGTAAATIKKAVTAKDLTAVGARSRVTATVNPDFSYRFAQGVKWQKSDAQGNVIDEGEDITQDPDDQGGTSSGNTDPGGMEP